MNFISMDFETANRYRSSACSIALVVVRNNEIVDSFYSLVNPRDKFEYRNIQVHGITPENVKTAPCFDEVWDHIYPLFDQNHLVAAHNASFDNSVLKASLSAYDITVPHYQSIDTLRVSKMFYPEFPNHKLNTVSELLDINLKQHHNALYDSAACAKILLKSAELYGDDKIKRMIKLT